MSKRGGPGRSKSSSLDASHLADILKTFITTPKKVDYQESSSAPVAADKIVKLKDMWMSLHEKEPTLSFTKTSVKKAFKEVRTHYGDHWKLKDEFVDAWADSMTTRFRLQAKHLKRAQLKGTIWMTTHFKSWYKKEQPTEAAAGETTVDGDEEEGDDDEDDDEEEEEAEAVNDATDKAGASVISDGKACPAASTEPSDGNALPAAEAELAPASPFSEASALSVGTKPLQDWTVGWNSELQHAFRKRDNVYEEATRIHFSDNPDDDGPVFAMFDAEGREEQLFLPDITKSLWLQMIAARTAGKHNPPTVADKLKPNITLDNGTILSMRVRSVNKEPYIIMLEDKQQILQVRIDEVGDDEAAIEFTGKLMSEYAKGTIKKVELRAKKIDGIKALRDKAIGKTTGKAELANAGAEKKKVGAAKEAAATNVVEVAAASITDGKGDAAKEAAAPSAVDVKAAASVAIGKPSVVDVKAAASVAIGEAGAVSEPPAPQAATQAASSTDVPIGRAPRTPKKRPAWDMDLSSSDSENPFEWVIG